MGKCCSASVNSMKHRVTVQSLTRAADGQGGFTEAWIDGVTLWAGIKPKKAYERFQAMQLATPITHEITMRYRPDVTSASRLKYGTRVFEVKEVINEDEQNRFLTVRAIETESEALVLTIGAILLRSGGHLRLRDGGKILLRA